MFVGWEVSCKNNLKKKENELHILFYFPVREGMKKLQKLDYLIPVANEQAPAGDQTNIFTRKAPFHYGWDWGPRLVTSGIWRPVYLKAWNHAKIEDSYIETTSMENDMAEIFAEVEINSNTGEIFSLSLLINGEPSGIKGDIQLIITDAYDIEHGVRTVSDNYFDLLPGHEKTVQIKTDLTLDPETGIKIASFNDLINIR